MKVINIRGKEIFVPVLNSDFRIEADVSALNSGTYTLIIVKGSSELLRKKNHCCEIGMSDEKRKRTIALYTTNLCLNTVLVVGWHQTLTSWRI